MKQTSKALHPIIEEIRSAKPIPRYFRYHGMRRPIVNRKHPDHPGHRKEARELIRIRLRAGIAALRSRGYDATGISRILGVARKTIEARMDESLESLHEFDAEQERLRSGERFEEDLPPAAGSRPRTSVNEHGIQLVTGDILPNPDEYQLQKDAFELRTRALPYHEIAALLGCSEADARNAVKRRAHYLEQDELTETALARRLQLDQIDQMVRNVFPRATAGPSDRSETYNAINSMVKLLEMKAKLLGLNAPQKVDLESRLIIIAREKKYDIEELKEIAAEVIEARQSALR